MIKLLAITLALVVATSASTGRILAPFDKTTPKTPPRTTSEHLNAILADRYVRGPVGIAVDTEPTSLEAAKTLWEETLNDVQDAGVDMILMPYSTSEIGTVTHTKGVGQFREVLEATKATPVPPHTDAGNFGGVAFYAVLRATEQVLYDGAVVLMTGRSAVDESLAQLAAATLIQKRCKLHVVWLGAVSKGGSPGHELLYREVALSTGGQFIVADRMDDDVDQDRFVEELMTSATRKPTRDPLATSTVNVQEVTLAVRREVSGAVETTLLVDSTVHALHVNITGKVHSALLRQPSGVAIDLLRRVATDGGRVADVVDVRVNTSAATPGAWTLETNGDPRYDVVVKALSKLSFKASVQGEEATKNGAGAGLLRLTMTGVGNVERVTLVDAHGAELHNLAYQRREDVVDEDPDSEVVTDLHLPGNVTLPNMVFVRLSGQDPTGAEFSRVTPITLERQQLGPNVPTIGGQQLPSVTVEMAINSTLNVLPNYWGQLIYEVTNNRNVPVVYRFNARDDRGYVRSVQPTQANIGPRLTYNVHVGIIAPADASYNSMDNVELIVQGPFETVKKTAQITVGDRVQDYERPLVWHWIKTNCQGYVAPNTCHTRIWSVELRIEDKNAGLMRVVSQPPGIRFTSEFYAGTKNSVTAYYSATCCENRVAITAVDAAGNYIKYDINGDDTYWGLNQGEIAAVSLGVILLIVLIILIILIICLCRGRTTRSHDLPVHPRSRK